MSTAMETLTSRVVPGLNLSESEIATWDALCKARPSLCSAFFSPHYTRSVAMVRPHVRVCILRRGSTPVGFFPFQFANSLYRALGAAERVGDEMTDCFGLIAEQDLHVDVPTMLQLTGLRHLNFTHLAESQFSCGLQGERPERGFVIRFDSGKSYWEELRTTNRKYVSETERKERQIQAAFGPLRFCWSEESWEQPLQMLIERKSQQYVRTGKEDWLAAHWKQKLLAVLAASKAETCQGVMSTLYAGDTWVASHFGLRCCGVLHYWFPVYNPVMSAYGPGHLLRKILILRGTEHRIQTIDHGLGDAGYKRVCANTSVTYYRGSWYRPGMPALLCRAAYSAKWRWSYLRKASA
jgi:CelD/BcsL family acetyltransferase involved in cellulose biosynthesis